MLVWVATACSNNGNKETVTNSSSSRIDRHSLKAEQFPMRARATIKSDYSSTPIDFTYTTTKKTLYSESVVCHISEHKARASSLETVVTPKGVFTTVAPQAVHKHNNHILKIQFDNDIFDNTDYYYTNGAQISLITPLAMRSPFLRLLPGLKNSQVNLSGFSILQNIYTPTNPDVSEVLKGDRPFSSFLSIGQFRESYNFRKAMSLKSSLHVGILGPAAMGDYVQSSIHEIDPKGWENQIQNTFVINYHFQIEKGLVSNPHFEMNLIGNCDVGTLYNKAGAGLHLRLGTFTPVYKGIINSRRGLQYWFILNGALSAVAYDATLQGAIFNDRSPYTIASHELNRLVAKASIGFAIYYNFLGLEFENFYWSPEYKGAYDFRYGRMSVIVNF